MQDAGLLCCTTPCGGLSFSLCPLQNMCGRALLHGQHIIALCSALCELAWLAPSPSLAVIWDSTGNQGCLTEARRA